MITNNDVFKVIEGAVNEFGKKIPTLQKNMLNELLKEAAFLKTNPDGTLKNNIENIRKINSLRSKLLAIVVNDDWKSAVAKYVSVFDKVTDLQAKYFKSLEKSYSPNEILSELKTQSKKDVIKSLTESGIGVNIGDRVINLLTTNVVSGGSYNSLAEQLRNFVIGTTDEGVVGKYAKQIVNDAVNQYTASYNHVAAGDLGYEWYVYDGTDIITTRPFCNAMTDQPYFHVTEVPRLLRAEGLSYVDPNTGETKDVTVNKRTNLPNGLIEGTNASNFFIRRGGYNCGHQIMPVNERQVPRSVVTRVKTTAEYERFKGITREDDLDKLKKLRSKGAPEVQKILDEIAKKFNAKATPVNFKGDERMLEKAKDDYGNEVGFVKDSLRATIVATSDKIDAILAELEKLPNLAGAVKRQRHATDALGYDGNIVNIYTKDGIVAEIQVNYPEMIFAKELPKDAIPILGQELYDRLVKRYGNIGGLGHKYYEEYRNKKIPPTAARSAELEILSREYYAKFVKSMKSSDVSAIPETVYETILANPRNDGESDVAYAKRVIDKIEFSPALKQEHAKYFTFTEDDEFIAVKDLVPVKDEPSTANAIKRMWAASEGFLSKRKPITVMKMADGKFLVLDGNSTYSAAKENGWSDIPVNVLDRKYSPESVAKTLGFVSAKQADWAVIRLTNGKYSSFKEAPDEIVIEAAKKIKDLSLIKNEKVNEGDLASIVNKDYDNVSREFVDAIEVWTGSSSTFRSRDETDAKILFKKGVSESPIDFDVLYRGEFYSNLNAANAILEYYNQKFIPGAIVNFSNKMMLTAKDGSRFEYDPYMLSFSKKIIKAESFSSWNNLHGESTSVMFILEKPKYGLDISKLSSYESEEEVVIGNGHDYEVVSVEREIIPSNQGRQRITIKLRQIPKK